MARLRAGGVAIFPTDTVMGVGCLASSVPGIAGVMELKGRDAGKPLILFVGSIDEVVPIAGALDPRVRTVLEAFWPGPLTAVLPLKGSFPRGIGRDGTVGIRIPNHPVPLALVKECGEPLATTSANPAGAPPFADSAAARKAWGQAAAAVEGRAGSVPSTVVDLTEWPPRILREGAIPSVRLEQAGGTASGG